MSDLLLASVSEKGQVTIPKFIRDVLDIKLHAMIGFRIDKGKVQLVATEVKEKRPYTKEEWNKIKKMTRQKGKSFEKAKEAKKYLRKF